MGTFKKLKSKLEADPKRAGSLLCGSARDILLDTDGDGHADIYILDTTGSGGVDALALELKPDESACLCFSGEGYLLFDDEGSGDLASLGLGGRLTADMTNTAARLLSAFSAGKYPAALLDELIALLDSARRVLYGADGSNIHSETEKER